jgi:hypothetical protein
MGVLRNGALIFSGISMTFTKWKHLTAAEPRPVSRHKRDARHGCRIEEGYRNRINLSRAKRLTSMGLRLLRNYVGILAIVALVLVESQFTNAASAPGDETQKIEAMIQDVRDLKDATFIRNGSSYNSKSAAIFLRRKWQASHSEVTTARDFIDKVASFSGTSGKPYLIRFKDGKEIPSREFLLAKLKTLEGW